MKPVTLEVVASHGCVPCQAFETYWNSVSTQWPNVTLKKYDITSPEGTELAGKHMILSSPGIIVNGELVSVGGFDQNTLVAKLKQVSE